MSEATASEQPVVDTARVLDKQWEEVQRKTFTKWVNSKTKVRGIPEIANLAEEFSDGVRLVQLLEIIGDETIKYNKNPKLRIQKVENVNRALEFIKSRGVQLFNIGGEDIVDSNQKLVLGMIWTIILRFSIADISEGELSAKEGLLLWCQRKTKGYKDVNVKEFTFSWQDGLAFAALIHRHRPDLIDFDSLDKSNKHHNLNLAFEVAEKHLGIARLLDVEDVADLPKPDERSIITYVAQYFHAFSNSDKLETAGRRVGKFAAAARSVWEMQNEYERRTRELLARIDVVIQDWAAASFDGTYADAIRHNQEFTTYKQTTKRESIREKRDLETLLSNITTKLKTYKLAPYTPPAGLSPADVDAVWANLTEAELSRRRSINENIRAIKESLRVEFAQLANAFASQLTQVSSGLAAVDGELDVQLQTVQALAADLDSVAASLPSVEEAYQRLVDANIEENDHTSYTPDDLAFDLETVRSSLRKKTAFIENQRVSQGITNVTPAQLEEFESTFRFFDKDQSNTLSRLEFKAGLAGLGFGYDDAEFEKIFVRVSNNSDSVTFEQFVEYMVSITEDRQNADQIKEAFAILSQNKGFITESDLRIGQLPQEDVVYLSEVMPRTENGYDYNTYVSSAFGN